MAHVFFSVLYVASYFVFARILPLIFLPGFLFSKLTRLDKLAALFPFSTLVVSVIPVAYMAGYGVSYPFGTDMISNYAGAVAWLILLNIMRVAYMKAILMPSATIGNFEILVNQRWPEVWYAKHLKRKTDAVFVRPLIANSVLLIPAVAALILPGIVTIYSAFFFVFCVLLSGHAHEGMDHIDLHNNLFRSRHLKGRVKIVVFLTNKYLRYLLNPMCCRIPGYYRTQHIYIHHVENNGVNDNQTTVFRDRASFFDFCAHALSIGLSYSFALDVYAYFRRRGKLKLCRSMTWGLLSWYLGLVSIAFFNPGAAIVVFITRFFIGVEIASANYIWHGFVDISDPENIYKNTVNVVKKDFPTIGALHVRHHVYGGENWAEQCHASAETARASEKNHALVFNAVHPNVLLKALWMKDFRHLASILFSLDKASVEARVQGELLQSRTRPLVLRQRSKRYHDWDGYIGAFFSRYMLS